ncbi:SDR family oxidoreductase [Leclercia adecarboxylata]|uniref:SDR family oxidoreductase n=1 Tax=Leclercia barmai TaxID=2785629 RepID=A0ABS7RPL9_9ENTR|nr:MULTISPECIES: SDR family oxidoreductase [Leclercia]MBZ0056306.1 SDR family oxidoreductase [Leclercia sp. EMC7]MCM5694272.1 SDR family oxidoreductase [Leclercia sp. LTM01]MCM5699343.1 SDR family oxidoreductase [Leclercia sp. LTM14]QCZ26026.1 SDR family oxidoreductase [Leclercia adecarboxylata]
MNHEKVALVFGGARGIGAAIAARLAHDGYRVAITWVSRPDRAQDVVSTIERQGGQAIAIEADSADAAAIQAAVDKTLHRYGRLDVAVVNAGVLRPGTIEEYALADLDTTLAVNVRGVFLAIQAAVKTMAEGGRVITIGSNTAVRTGHAGSSVYAMSKAAVASMVQNLALDLAPRRITINNIQPGPVATDMTASMVDQITPLVPLQRIGKPEEIASLAAWLAGESSGYMTGSSLTIDGGFVL